MTKKVLRINFLMLVLLIIFNFVGTVFAQDNFLKAIDWDVRHHFEFYEELAEKLSSEYPYLVSSYSIGRSWRERDLWMIELSSKSEDVSSKIPIAVIGNIHGPEHESAESAAYIAWWFATNYGKDSIATDILDKYILYVLPIMNPDGFEQSFVYPTRQNLRPTDHNGDGIPFGDPYCDVNGDGVIAEVYVGERNSLPKDRVKIGMESPDFDKNGIPGDDPISSYIDLNRTFDYMWSRYDAISQVGQQYGTTAGPSSASEPEVTAVQNFLIENPVWALATLHTGIQCTLFPWCYSPEPIDDHDFMENVSMEMSRAWSKASGRPSYFKQSHFDYPTAAEMIDWAYGRLNIHAYTIEVYAGGPSGAGSVENYCRWGDNIPEDEWIWMGDWQGHENVWFKNTGRAKMVGIAPPEQGKMCEGTKDAVIVMIQSEPYGDGPSVPNYLKYSR